MKKTFFLILTAWVLSIFVTGCSASFSANENMRLAVEWRQQGDMEMYKSTVKRAYKADPANPFVLNGMGTIAESEERYGDAESFYRQALQKAGNEVVLASDVKGDQGLPLKDVVAQNLKNLQGKMK